MRRTETRGSSSLRMLCKAVNMLSACNPGRHKPQWKKKQDNYRSSNGYEARNHLEMLSKRLFFFFFFFQILFSWHAVTSGNCFVSSLLTSCCMTPWHHNRFLSAHQTPSQLFHSILEEIKSPKTKWLVSSVLGAFFFTVIPDALHSNEDVVKMFEQELHQIWDYIFTNKYIFLVTNKIWDCFSQ